MPQRSSMWVDVLSYSHLWPSLFVLRQRGRGGDGRPQRQRLRVKREVSRVEGLKMEQWRKSLAEIFISGTEREEPLPLGGASPLPLVHFLFLLPGSGWNTAVTPPLYRACPPVPPTDQDQYLHQWDRSVKMMSSQLGRQRSGLCMFSLNGRKKKKTFFPSQEKDTSPSTARTHPYKSLFFI